MSAYFNSQGRNRLTKTISFTSGKGGVGKTSVVSNLAAYLAARGSKVLILDGDFGMANVEIMFGRRPSAAIADVLSGAMSLSEAIVEVSSGIWLIPGGSGVYGLQNLNAFQKRSLLDQVNSLELAFDFMLVDTAPGIDENVLYLNTAAQESVVILTPDPSSLADAYALIKVLNTRYKQNRFSILCNSVRDEAEGLRVYQRLSDVVERFLCVSLDYIGSVPFDKELRKATKSQQLVVQAEPRCPSSFAIGALAQKLSGYRNIEHLKGGMQFFWEQLVGVA